MDILITIPDGKKDAVINAFALQYRYQEEIEDDKGDLVPNPINKGEFALNIIKSFIKDVYVADKVDELDGQRANIITEATTDLSGLTVE